MGRLSKGLARFRADPQVAVQSLWWAALLVRKLSLSHRQHRQDCREYVQWRAQNRRSQAG